MTIPHFIHSLKLFQAFQAIRLKRRWWARLRKRLLTTTKLKECVFSHIVLFPNAVMLHSDWVTLILFRKIPLIFEVACHTKTEMKMLRVEKTLTLCFTSSHYVNRAQVRSMLVYFPVLCSTFRVNLWNPSPPTPPHHVAWVLFVLLGRRVVKEIESNGRTTILSLLYRLFINLTIRSDACLLLESVHTHSTPHQPTSWP